MDFSADVREAAVFFVFLNVVGVDGHDDAGETVVGEAAHVVFGPQPAIAADHRSDAGLGGIADHGADVAVDHGFASDEEQITDVVADADVDDAPGFLEGDGAPVLGIEFGSCEAAETTVRVAEIGDGELEIAGAGVVEDFAEELKRTFFGWTDGRRLGGGRRRWPRS